MNRENIAAQFLTEHALDIAVDRLIDRVFREGVRDENKRSSEAFTEEQMKAAYDLCAKENESLGSYIATFSYSIAKWMVKVGKIMEGKQEGGEA